MLETQAAVLLQPGGPIRVQPVALRGPGAGEVLVRLEACGLCHSDLFVASQQKLPLTPLVLGHEGIGRVEALGPEVTGFSPGDRVGLTFLASTCGVCALCRGGRDRFCARQLNFGYTVNGALAAYAVAPAAHLARVPEGLAAADAAPLCCAGWTAYGALRTAALQPGQSVALFGMGGLGHLAVQYARHLGLRVVALDVSEEKLAMARRLGAELALDAAGSGRVLQKQCGGVDAAIVLTSSAAPIPEAFRGLKRTGALVLVGLSAQPFELPVVDAILRGITIRGSYLGSREDLEEVFRLAQVGVARAEVNAHVLEETPELLERMRRGELLGRAVVTF